MEPAPLNLPKSIYELFADTDVLILARPNVAEQLMQHVSHAIGSKNNLSEQFENFQRIRLVLDNVPAFPLVFLRNISLSKPFSCKEFISVNLNDSGPNQCQTFNRFAVLSHRISLRLPTSTRFLLPGLQIFGTRTIYEPKNDLNFMCQSMNWLSQKKFFFSDHFQSQIGFMVDSGLFSWYRQNYDIRHQSLVLRNINERGGFHRKLNFYSYAFQELYKKSKLKKPSRYKSGNTISFMNSFEDDIDYSDTFGKFPSSTQNKREKYLLALIGALVYNLVVSFVFISLMVIYDSKAAIFLGNLVPDKYYVFPIPLLACLVQCYLYLISHIIYLVACTGIVVYSYYVTPFLVQDLRRRTNTYGAKNPFRLPQSRKFQHVYRCLQLLQANVFGVIGIFVVILNASYMLAIIFCNVVMIRYWSDLEIVAKSALLIWTIFFTTFWCTVMELGRFYFLKGTKTINSWSGGDWGTPKQNKIMRKFIKSCKPIVIGYGKQFVLGRVSIITFFRGVGRGIFRALLTTRKELIL
ncbi:unnamed protein product [Orchesella dallaii]|uniref:Uncharacterized protein n=1 Tax=Orchesella dallaii TaxID=48710 RepID=A0ABP1PIT3_9HEXA